MMKSLTTTFSLLLLLPALPTVDAATLRRSDSSSASDHGVASNPLIPPARILQDGEMRDFVPLACNRDIERATCKSWSAQFSPADTYTERVIIPCGECITMDLQSDTLTLLDGIDVQGKLVFPDGYQLDVISNMIVVQGHLEMTANKPVDGEPLIQFTMTGEDSVDFRPVGENVGACKGSSSCGTGKKSITVAGGKVDSKYYRKWKRIVNQGNKQSGGAESLTHPAAHTSWLLQFTDCLPTLPPG